ncbi:MAG: (S)-benzoin forming benzil reductase [Bacteroidetes bacterium]|nr:MAG: (S)-benzoin forming benzil reductase [Bacteroidota bacterium]
MHHYIITGTSRGIGEALAYALLSAENRLYCISRTPNRELQMEAEATHCALRYYQQDLAHTYDALHLMGVILEDLSRNEVQSVTFIQNAALLEPVAPVGKAGNEPEQLVQHINVNLSTPMLMTHEFVRRTQEWAVPKKLLNISSGAARKPRHAWSAYCSTKAGLEMYSRCLALEQSYEPHPLRVASVAPGVVDTAMQEILRAQQEENFREVGRFRQLKEEGKLWTPDFVANELLKLLKAPNFGEEVVLDLRDLVA